MKNNIKPSFHYSAYPLKIVEQAIAANEDNPSPHLKALLSTKTSGSRIRVYPMANPYKNKGILTPRQDQPKKDIEPNGKDWFINYE